MSKQHFTEEERQARSLRAKEMVAKGKIGGAEYGKLGGRPRKKRSSEIFAEKVTADAEAFYNRLRDIALDDEENAKASIDAIKHIQLQEELERKINVEEEVRYEQLKHAELLELVASNFAQLVAEGRLNFADVIDVEPIEARPAIGPGEID